MDDFLKLGDHINGCFYDVRKRLRVFGMTGFTRRTLHALRIHAQRIVDFYQVKVNLHTLSGGVACDSVCASLHDGV